MNRLTIINGLEGEGKSQELLALDFIAGLKGEIDSKMSMRHYVITGADYETTVSLVEYLIDGMKESIPKLGEGVRMGVMRAKTMDDFRRIVSEHADDAGTVFYIDSTELIPGFTMDELMDLMDEHQFDCYVTRQRDQAERMKV